MNLREYLFQQREQVPEWLAGFVPGSGFDPRFLASRTVYYPGSGSDGQPIRLFNSAHAVHCFVYVDSGLDREKLERELDDPEKGFAGYHRLDRVEVGDSDLAPAGWAGGPEVGSSNGHEAEPYAFMDILERNPDVLMQHGGDRLAVLFICREGVGAYDTLFCRNTQQRAPWAVVVQDHGMTHGAFGRGGRLEYIAAQARKLPDWLFAVEDSDRSYAWSGYERVPDVDGERGGLHATVRRLFRRRRE